MELHISLWQLAVLTFSLLLASVFSLPFQISLLYRCYEALPISVLPLFRHLFPFFLWTIEQRHARPSCPEHCRYSASSAEAFQFPFPSSIVRFILL
jgi:hypothetical protein